MARGCFHQGHSLDDCPSYTILQWALGAVTVLFGLAMGFVAVQLQKVIIILATSYWGSGCISFSTYSGENICIKFPFSM